MAIYISKQTGLWSTASTWLTALPAATFSTNAAMSAQGDAGAEPQSGAGDRFIIRGGNIVTYDVIGDFGNDGSFFANTDVKFLSNAIAISATGSTLKCHRTNATSLSCRGSIMIGFGGVFDWGITSDPVTASAELVFGTYSSTISPTISARTGRCGVFTRTGVGTNYHKLLICGNTKTRNSVLSGSATAGTSLLTATDVTGWNVGDKVVIEPHTVDSTTFINIPISAYNISAINGNVITLDRNLPYTYPSGLSVGNFSSNITYKSAYFVNGTTPVACGPQMLVGQNTLGEYTIKNVSFENITQPSTDNDNTSVISTFGCIYSDISNGLVPVTIDNISILTDKNYVANYIGYLNKSAATHTIKNYAAADVFPTGRGDSVFVFSRFGPRISISDSVGYRNYTTFSFDQTNTDQLYIKNVRANSNGNLFAGNFSVNDLKVDSSNFRYTRGIFSITFISKASISDCTFVGTNNTAFRLADANNIGSWAFMTFNNNTFVNVYRPEPLLLGNPNTFSDSSYFNFYGINSNTLDNRRTNSFYSLSSDYTNRNRGLASYKAKAAVANNPYYITETTDGFAGSTKRFIGYIKYDAIYGTATLPYITFSDANQTATQTFSCSPTPNIWQKFDLSLTPASNGLITMTFTGQTSSITANAYLDGLPFYPITPKARHYGFNFDEAIPNRTIDTLTTLTENQVSAVSLVNNLDYLYDASNYWSVTNPTLTAYTDLYTRSGAVLDFGSKNITLSSTATTGLTYLSASNNVILKTTSLSAGINFNTLTTTGTLSVNGGTVSNITLNCNVKQTTPSNLTSVNINGVLTYDTNNNYNTEYTNTNVLTAKNDGSGDIFIKKTNSTITDQSDAQIKAFAATYISLTLQSGYIAIYDNNGVQQYYRNTDTNGSPIELPYAATGTWTYKIAKYGYKLVTGSFTINSAVGGTVTIAPIYVQDIYVSDTVGNVISYTTFYKTQQVYDYLSYYRTTSAGLSAGDLNSYISTLNIGSNNIILFDSSSPAFSYDGSTFTLNSLNLSGADITTTGTISLSGNSAISNITLTTDVLDQTPADLTNVTINGTLAYNTNTSASITYTNTTVSTVVNNGSGPEGMILIQRINSSINNATDPEIDDYAPTIINVTPDGGSVAIYDDSNVRQYFITTTSTVVLPFDATGTWSYKVAKYGFDLINQPFTINSSTGATINIVPNYVTDSFIDALEANVENYTDLNTANQIHDYLMYFQTLSTGIDYGDLEFETFGTITFTNSLALSANASSMVSLSGTTVVLKSTYLTDDIVLVSTNGNITQHSGNTISDGIKLRANNLDSEIYFNTVDSITFYPNATDRDNNVNGNITLTSASIYRFKYGSTVSGITFTNYAYARVTVGGATLLVATPIALGTNTIDFGVTGNLQTLNNNLRIVNQGVQKSSILVPHTTNI